MPGSLLGSCHEQAARRMTLRALAAIVAACAALVVLTAPLLLLLPAGLVVYGAAEAVFAVLYWYRYMLLSYQPIKHRPLGHDAEAVFARTMQHLRLADADMAAFLSIWFHGTPLAAIPRDNVKDLIAYAFWYKMPADIAAEGNAAALEQQVAYIETTWGLQLQPGFDPQLRCMQHMWEPMKHWYRPLAFYLAMEVATLMCRLALQAAGFSRATCMGLPYYTANMAAPQQRGGGDGSGSGSGGGAAAQQHQQEGAADVPLVFVHGLGMGLVPYIGLLFNVAATGRPLLALELPHISQRWVLWVPTVDEVAVVLTSILDRNAIPTCCLMGHSYGTAVASRMLTAAPQRVGQLCLIDPIVFAMFMPNLLRSFLYEPPGSGSWLGDFMMLSAARELHVSATLSRRFFWSDVNLWAEQLPPDTLVVLSGRDVLMAAREVKAWLEQHTASVVMFHPTLVHAAFVLDLRWQQQILQQLLPLIDARQDAEQPAVQPPQQQQQQQQHGQQHPQLRQAVLSRAHEKQVLSAPACGCGGGSPDTVPAHGPAAHGALLISAASCSSSASQSFASCSDSISSCSSAGSSGSRAAGPCAAAGGARGRPTCCAAAPAASPFLGAAGLLSSPREHSTGRLSASTPPSTELALSSGYSLGGGSIQPQPTAAASRSRDGSLELPSALYMRSWSGVLPSAPLPASTTGGGTASEALESAGLPESPRSAATFFSASSVQSKRSMAAAAAAQEAARAAHALLHPLLAMQQRRQRQQQQRRRRHSWDGPQTSMVSLDDGGGVAPSSQQLLAPAASGASCLVSCSAGASPEAPGTTPAKAAPAVPQPRPALGARRAAAARRASVGGGGADGARQREPQQLGVLRVVEGLLQRRHTKPKDAATAVGS